MFLSSFVTQNKKEGITCSHNSSKKNSGCVYWEALNSGLYCWYKKFSTKKNKDNSQKQAVRPEVTENRKNCITIQTTTVIQKRKTYNLNKSSENTSVRIYRYLLESRRLHSVAVSGESHFILVS